MKTIDANIILRFLTNDLPEQANRAASLLRKLEQQHFDKIKGVNRIEP
jgi:predicted nucleic acid-binding protein